MPYADEVAVLLGDLRVAFDAGVFERAYPGFRAPTSVSIGGDSSAPPFEVVVNPIPTSVSNAHRSANGCSVITTEFELVVGAYATGATEEDAAATAFAYVDCITQALMADPTLHGLVDHARPEFGQGGVGPDESFGSACGANVRVSCRRDIPQNKAIARAVREAA